MGGGVGLFPIRSISARKVVVAMDGPHSCSMGLLLYRLYDVLHLLTLPSSSFFSPKGVLNLNKNFIGLFPRCYTWLNPPSSPLLGFILKYLPLSFGERLIIMKFFYFLGRHPIVEVDTIVKVFLTQNESSSQIDRKFFSFVHSLIHSRKYCW